MKLSALLKHDIIIAYLTFVMKLDFHIYLSGNKFNLEELFLNVLNIVDVLLQYYLMKLI